VYQRLAAQPEIFDVAGVGTRNVKQAIAAGVPAVLITDRLEALIAEPVDVVIELLGGEEPARALVARALRLGKNIVTANKALLAHDLAALQNLAAMNGVSLRYSAAAGGALPAFESISRARRVGQLSSIAGVLNGTTNFILDHLANGVDFNEAIAAAQQNGYAERDPRLDLDGTDAAQKLILLAKAAFDVDLPFHAITRRGIESSNPREIKEAKTNGRVTRLVAECRRTAHGFSATVSPIEVPLDHAFANVHGVENRVLINFQNGRTWDVRGRGAGRWPTTEAVMGDLFELCRESVANKAEAEQECVA
jgi:homoserine dehydrogenase